MKTGKIFVRVVFVTGIITGAILIILMGTGAKVTSTNNFCNACHVHPHVTTSWKMSTHYDNQHGFVTNCVDCHLPPSGWPYYREKVKTGARDVWGVLFKDTEKINWEERSRLEHAVNYTYEASCLHCHVNLFPRGLSREGEKAHLHYEQNPEELRCINCHLGVGHYDEDLLHARNIDFGEGVIEEDAGKYEKATVIDTFANFTENVPGTTVSFDMVAIPGGTFIMGSPKDEPTRDPDEGPQVEVQLNPFFMGKVEVSWDEYLVFFGETSKTGRSSDAEGDQEPVDGISGPTPPWGAPDQGWGKGKRPAITMTHYAATVYCEWLSEKTGKKYRLPTEAEWEYAARGGTTGPYFFEGNPAKLSRDNLFTSIFGKDTSTINDYVIYKGNSNSRTGLPDRVEPNPFGLFNMLGNVAEFCSDYYNPDIYSTYENQPVINPKGPDTGHEHVVRGGSYKSEPADVRCASREFTRTMEWLKTDPQMPKSKWWYSDVTTVGFRIVCEYEDDYLSN
ncbi:MAG: SUMF1/EgtB/PvdO family nonheme iron enzyme [Bacteroidota bacterium]